VRMSAAAVAIPYEFPKLAVTAVVTKAALLNGLFGPEQGGWGWLRWGCQMLPERLP
jgi:hypothetical protein